MTCSHARILADNQIIHAEITANRPTINTELNESNLKNFARTAMARWDLSANVVITINLPKKERLDFFVALGSNMSLNGTSSMTIYDGQNATGEIKYQGSPDIGGFIPAGLWRPGIDPYGAKDPSFGKGKLKDLLETPVTWQSAVLTISDAANSDGYIELRTLMMGESYEFSTKYDFGTKLTIRGNADHQQSESGFTFTGGIRGKAKQLPLPYKLLTKRDRIMLSLLQERHGDYPWYIMARPWETGLMKEQYEFAAAVEIDGYTVVSHNQHSAQLLCNEV